MAIGLYDLTVPNYLQTLTALAGVLDKGAAHAASQGRDLKSYVEARLAPDMLPLSFQVVSAAHHSLGALEAVKSGTFSPPSGHAELDYAGLQKRVSDAIAALKAMTPAEIDGLSGKDVTFALGSRQIPFLAEGFLQSFSFPNFYFHASAAYAILRNLGVPLGKRDFLGQLRLKT